MGKVAIFGAGSWGTAFSIVLADAGNDVTIWGRRDDVCATITEATTRIMAAIVQLVADLRGESAPTTLFDPRTSGVRPIGNPRKQGEST